jgi:hypothetical protein
LSKRAAGIMLTLLLIGMLTLTLDIQPIKAKAEPPATEWSKTYGGSRDDAANSIIETSDGGYAVCGLTRSFGAGSTDFWLVKIDVFGSVQWTKTYGGTEPEEATSVVQTNDGGYMLAGHTASFGTGSWDIWLVKTDAYGNVQWNKTYGGPDVEYAYCVAQTSDGGYIVTGQTISFGAGYTDFYLVKTDASGIMQWNKTYGGALSENSYSVIQTVDGGYMVVGGTDSFGPPSRNDWLVKTDANGDLQWSRTYGGADCDQAYSVVQTSDGKYAIAGYTQSFGIGFWLVKTDVDGSVQWNKTYGGGSDEAYSVKQTSDGGFILAGPSYEKGDPDFWLVKTDSSGNMEWNKTYGGASYDIAKSVVQTSDRGYIVAGYTQSFGAGGWDFLVIKLAGPGITTSISPLSASMNVGQSVTFTSAVSGGYPPYTYQWYLNGNPVLGANASSWTFAPTTSGIYYVYLKVTDAQGNTAQSDAAGITVAAVPVGGYSIPIQTPATAKPLTPYLILTAILTIALTTIKHKTTKKTKKPP